jgi:hypothetical protein
MWTRDGREFRCYYETVPSETVTDPDERARIAMVERDGFVVAMLYAAGEDPALGALAPRGGTCTPLSQAEFVKARDAGWPQGVTHEIAVGGTLDVTPSLDA